MDINDTFYKCTRATKHNDECDGNCGEYELTETDKELYYEIKRWELSGLRFEGIPSVLKDGPFNGVIVDALEVLLRIQALCNLLIEKEVMTEDEYRDALQAQALKRMTTIRENREKQLAKEKLLIAQSKLLGPDGKQFH